MKTPLDRSVYKELESIVGAPNLSEDDGIVLARQGAGKPIHAVGQMVAGMAKLLQSAREMLGGLPVILDQ